MDTFTTDAVVIGAGVVGLACAAELAQAGLETVLLEATDGIGTGCSSRNSEVIHAGIYYPTNSLKHRFCIEGRRRLYPYLDTRGVPHRKCGKLIVATSDAETGQLEGIFNQARSNGVEDIALLTGSKAMSLEGDLSCTAAILSPETGILDSHGLMLALQGQLEDNGGIVAFNSPIEKVTIVPTGGFIVYVGGSTPTKINCRILVNSAGLHAQAVASEFEGLKSEHIPPLYLAKGSYFGCATKSPFSHLIYPAPVDGGLGVHVTLDLGGRMRFGPDVEWLDTSEPDQVNYKVDLKRAESFYSAIRRYWPALQDGSITPDYAGCRPKLSARGQPAADFRVDGPELHGIDGLVNLFGIESPGLTSSLAIGLYVAGLIAA
jgi:L-2-hydroxyglutarate oxidase LhgO